MKALAVIPRQPHSAQVRDDIPEPALLGDRSVKVKGLDGTPKALEPLGTAGAIKVFVEVSPPP